MKPKRKDKKESGSNSRVRLLSVVIFLLFAVILIRLVHLQVLKYGFYRAMAQDQHEFYTDIVPQRGIIYMKDDASGGLYPVAVNRETNLIYVVPRNINEADREKTARILAERLELDYDEVWAKVNKADDPYEVIKNKVPEETAAGIEEEGLAGIGIAPESLRYYPGGELAANVIGFVGYSGNERKGQYGIEGYCEDRLKGKSGFLSQEKDASGSWISFGDKSLKSAKDGDDVVLTLDYTVQYLAEKKLKEGVEKYGAEKGTVIIMDPSTGAIKAMADYPTFNPNDYSKVEDMSVYLNSAVHDVYEPGSVQKVITMAIGIDTGKVSPSTTYTDTGLEKIDGWSIRNSDYKANGVQTMVEVLEKSLNTGTIFVERQVGKKNFYDYLKRFGLDSPTGIELSGEAVGNLSNLETNSDINYATASFGQGIAVTPVGLITAVSALVNDGKLMKPYIIDSIKDADGNVTKTEPQVVRQAVSARTANLVSAMMVSVVDNGHAKGAQIPGYKIGGKTGTAQIPSKDKKGYDADRTIHTFVGFGPMPNPKFTILVKLDAPRARFAESTSVKVFNEIAKELVQYYHLAPTEEVERK
jgi:cell division protein FtsI/penicillin-binding protein 2